MVATPFDITVILRRLADGSTIVLTGDCTDVANALVTWKETGDLSTYQVPGNSGGVEIDDIQGSAAGVDTTRIQLIVDTVDKPIRLRSGVLANLTTSKESRVPRGLRVAPGSQLQMRQLA